MCLCIRAQASHSSNLHIHDSVDCHYARAGWPRYFLVGESDTYTRPILLSRAPLQPPAALCHSLPAEPAEGSKVQKVVFATVRPADYSLPYTTLEKNSVAFSAVDKRSNKLLTVMVRPEEGLQACGEIV